MHRYSTSCQSKWTEEQIKHRSSRLIMGNTTELVPWCNFYPPVTCPSRHWVRPSPQQQVKSQGVRRESRKRRRRRPCETSSVPIDSISPEWFLDSSLAPLHTRKPMCDCLFLCVIETRDGCITLPAHRSALLPSWWFSWWPGECRGRSPLHHSVDKRHAIEGNQAVEHPI